LALELLYQRLEINPVYGMKPQIPKAAAPKCPKNGFKAPFWAGMVLVLSVISGTAHALYPGQGVNAYRIADDKIKVDGTPDSLWKAISSIEGAVSSIAFNDYGKMVILQPDSVRNADPSKYVTPAPTGSIFMLAAFDTKSLYFYFQVKTKTIANAKTLCTDPANIWKADAAEVFVDPASWSADPDVYRTYFSADAGGLIYGTSSKTVQMDRPLNDTRTFFRNRASADKFQTATLPAGASTAVARYSRDTTTVSVEMKIPFWGGSAAAFAPGKSMFISWGFNMYPANLSNCNGDPIAYRWAKHYLSYDAAPIKPPGWRAKDSTHYDPLRSWDGWGRFNLSSGEVVDSKRCIFQDPASWNLSEWKASGCIPQTVRLTGGTKARDLHRPISGSLGSAHGRDLRGRSTSEGVPYYIFPKNAPTEAPGTL
jgi:hypothetical protein